MIRVSVDAVEVGGLLDARAVRIEAPLHYTLDAIEDDLRANWRDPVCMLVLEAMFDGVVTREQWVISNP